MDISYLLLRNIFEHIQDAILIIDPVADRIIDANPKAMEPDIVLMDLVMPDMDGVETTKALLTQYPELKIIALTSFGERDLVRRTIQAGAIGYLLKNATAEELIQGIHAAIQEKPVLGPEAARALIDEIINPGLADDSLDDQEVNILKLIAEGLTNLQIAEEVGMSRGMIKQYVSSIFSKLDVNSRTEAVAVGFRNRVIS